MNIEKIYAEQTLTITELKANPGAAFHSAKSGAVAVLSHNKPQGYILSKEMYEHLVETLASLEQIREPHPTYMAELRKGAARLKMITSTKETAE